MDLSDLGQNRVMAFRTSVSSLPSNLRSKWVEMNVEYMWQGGELKSVNLAKFVVERADVANRINELNGL